MVLSDRDVRILISLRHGILEDTHIRRMHFMSSEISSANPAFKKLVSNQVTKAESELNQKNQRLISELLKICRNSCHELSHVEIKLLKAAKTYGQHIGRPLYDAIRNLNNSHAPLAVTQLEEEILERIQQLITYHLEKKNRRKNIMLCAKVMKKLIKHGLVREVIGLNIRGTQKYYHLTKLKGAPLVSEIMAERNCYEKVIAHNYSPVHARHDSMVSMVTHKLNEFKNEQSYSINSIKSEAEQKSLLLQKRMSNRKNRRKDFFLSDLLVDLNIHHYKRDSTLFQIEIDNGTQPLKNIIGKATSGAPILFLCSNSDRVNYITHSLINYNYRNITFFCTTIMRFYAGGIFKTEFLCYPDGQIGKICIR